MNLFGANDSIIPWNYTETHLLIVLSLRIVPYFIGKIAYLMSFGFNTQLILSDNKHAKPSIFLNIWMLIVGLIMMGINIYLLISEIKQKTNMYTTSIELDITFMITDANQMAQTNLTASMAILSLICVIYYGVLMYFYINSIKKMRINDVQTTHKSIKGLILLIVSSLFFYVFMVVGMINFSIGIFAFICIDMISDDVCLLLLFHQYNNWYLYLCQLCNVCCIKCIFTKKYHAVNHHDEEDINSIEASL
eukprot:107352_1